MSDSAPLPPLRVTQTVAGAMVLALVVYGVIAGVVAARPPARAPNDAPPPVALLRIVFGLLAGPMLVLPIFLPALVRRQKSTEPPPTPERRFQIVVLMQFALIEAVGIFGLMLALLAHHMLEYVYFGLPAFAMMAWHFPTSGKFQEFLSEERAGKR